MLSYTCIANNTKQTKKITNKKSKSLYKNKATHKIKKAKRQNINCIKYALRIFSTSSI